MKHPYLCVCLTFVMCLTAYHSGVRLNAAELWNSTRSGASSSDSPSYFVKKKEDVRGQSATIYNDSRKSNQVNRKTLFNSKNSSIVSSNGGGLDEAIHAYNNVKMGKQRPSRQFKSMSPNAVSNRQADIDLALQHEYDRRKATARMMIDVAREVGATRARTDRERQEELVAIREEKEAKALAAQRKKDRAIGKNVAYRTSNRNVRYKKSSSSSDLKKPTRLFNDPNN